MATLIVEGKIPNGFALIRPPGHHALRDAANGFCIFNNVAQAAEAAYNFGASRTLIVDLDVHHGQGIQRSFYEEKRVMYVSIHRFENGKFWPHLAESNFDHVGKYSAIGYNINIPLNEKGCGDSDYMTAFWNVIWPLAKSYNPHFVLVAAGFDACQGDPLGAMDVSPDLFAHIVYHLKGLAGGKMLLCLEGGYNEHNTAICVERCIRVLLGEAPNPLPQLPPPKRSTVVSCLNAISVLLPHWQQCFGFYALEGTLHSDWEIHHADTMLNVPSAYERVNTDSIEQSTLPVYPADTLSASGEADRVTALAYDPRVELHREEIDTGHMECPERTSAIASQLRGSGLLRRCRVLPAREATLQELELIHERPHVRRMARTAQIDESERRRDEACFDSIYFCKDSFRASLAAVGSLLECVDAVLDENREEGRANNGFALIRPPGHHAKPSQAGGFCIFNNVAIAAKYAIDKYGLERILIVDWDVHHGNGIQDAFYYDPHVLYVSVHRHDDGYFYPANEPKDVEDAGGQAGLGYNINIPFSHKCMGDNDYHAAFNKVGSVVALAFKHR
ncbi:unnamed protein product [Toxocara canis]|uniref:histone deacetylase n=1 Tax=Toxocara canis TaxID=6265 RepID=A0A183VAV7_TOXCA|nr:unnamed protein product [Toxocara canis]